jgi:hypothetical protein
MYIEKKVIIPILYLNDINGDNYNNHLYFDSLFNKYNLEIFNNNNIDIMYNNYITDIKDNSILIDNLIEKKIKSQMIFNILIKKYLKCNKITFLIITELL